MQEQNQLEQQVAAAELARLSAEEKVRELTIELQRMREESERRQSETESLLQALQVLANSLDSDSLFLEMSQLLHQMLEFEHILLLKRVGDDQLQIVAADVAGFNTTPWRIGSFFGRVLNGQTVALFDVEWVPEWAELVGSMPVVSALHMPIITPTLEQVLVFTHSEKGYFTRQHIELAERFLPMAVQTLRNAELLSQLRSERDLLESRVTDRTQELRSQRDFALQVMGTMGQGLAVLDEHGRFTYVNPAFVEMLSCNPQKMHGRHPDEMTVAGAPNGFLPFAEGEQVPETAVTTETRLQRADGDSTHVLITSVPQHRNGKFHGAIAVITDLNERKAVEQALRASEAEARKLSQVASRTSNMVVIANPRGHIEWVNDAFTRITGYELDEVIGRRPGDFLQGPDSDPETIAYMRAQLRKMEGFKCELLNYNRDGVPYWVDVEVQPVRDDHGEVTNFIGVESDITERKQYESAIRESEERIRLVVDTALDAVIGIRQDSTVIEWNKQAEQIFGWSKDEALGSMLSDLIIPHEFREAHHRGMSHYLATGEGPVLNKRIEIVALRRSGEVFPIELAISPVNYGDELTFSAFVRDITERKASEEALLKAKEAAEAADRAKSEFLANMSHEIRTPMNAVLGLSGLLLDTELDEEQRDYVETIRRGGDTLLTIINEILDFSKIEAGRLELDIAPFEVRECIEDALDLVSTQASEKRLDLAYFVEPDVPYTLVGDATRLRQIIVNLTSNAIKFTDEGEVVVLVDGAVGDDGRFQLNVAVRDTGIGIAPEQIERIFKPFTQADASTTRKHGGTGLGLVICRRLVDMMDGDIGVESVPGEGATFSFVVQLGVAARQSAGRTSARSTFRGRKALVVDDNATNRRIVAHYLEQWGFELEIVDSSVGALQLVADGYRYDVAVLDVHMPGVDGISLAKLLLKQPELDKGAIVFLSSSGRAETDADGLPAVYLNKPLKPTQLHTVLIDLLQGEEPRPQPLHTVRPERPKQIDDQLGTRHPLRILLAEDNLINQKVALRMLDKLGYRADVAANGLEVLDALERQPYDVVLMDIQMPEMDGVSATLAIHDRYKARSRPRIVAMTAHALEGDRETYLNMGADDYVSKPVAIHELVGALERTRPLAVHHQAQGQESIIDMETLEAQFGDEAEEMLAMLLPVYVQETLPQCEALREAWAAQDGESVWQIAHAIKGASATMGVAAIAELAQAVESQGRSGDLSGLDVKIEEMGVLLTAVAERTTID